MPPGRSMEFISERFGGSVADDDQRIMVLNPSYGKSLHALASTSCPFDDPVEQFAGHGNGATFGETRWHSKPRCACRALRLCRWRSQTNNGRTSRVRFETELKLSSILS